MLLSFVITAYNRADKVCRAIESVLQQISDPSLVEILVIDDGSIDDTQKLLEPYVLNQTIRLFTHEVNRGVGAAKNTGIINSRNEYIVSLDSDDMLDNGALEVLISFVGKNKYDVIFFGTKVLQTGRYLFDPKFTGLKTYRDFLTSKIGEYLPVCRNEVMKKFLMRDLRGYESITWLSIARAGYQIYYDSKPLILVDYTGEDRLTNKINRIQASAKMYKGARVYLNEFGNDIRKVDFKRYLMLNVKCIGYFALRLIPFKRKFL
jgi:glycosyltransferase involved in cell wall biosynthesis